jgi:hypothetical protein
MKEKSCGNCVNCGKYTANGKEQWYCDNYFGCEGMPYTVSPPRDEACRNWTDDPKKKNKALIAMHRFTDNFWG